MILPILSFPDKRLKTKAKVVSVVDDSIKSLIDAMFLTMYNANGVGLAATQVDKHLCIFVADCGMNNENRENKGDKNPLCFINPQIIQKTGETINEEGCLSVPEFYADIKRAKKIVIKALNANGKEFELEAEGFLAICIQHEIDHLNGILFIDYLSKLKQKRLLKKIEKI